MKRTKLIASLMMCVMCLSVLSVGVYAAVNVGFSFNSQLTFNPEGVYVDISAQMYRGTNYALLSPLSGEGYSFTGNNYDIIDGEPAGNTAISWENIPSVTLVPGNRTVKYRIEVTNMSEESIQGTASPSISGTIGSGNTSTVGGVTTTTYDNLTTTEYSQYIKNIQPNDTQVYEYIVELNENASSATINVSIGFNFVERAFYTIEFMPSTTDNFELNYVNLGFYPQSYVGNTFNNILEEKLNTSSLVETGKIYTTFDGCNSPISGNDATPNLVENKEYLYSDGNKYVRVENASYDYDADNYTYSNGEAIDESNKIIWFKVEPIQWRVVVDNESTAYATLLCENAITSNIPFYPGDISYNDVENYARSDNTIRNYLLNYFYNDAFSIFNKSNIENRDFAEGECEYSPSDYVTSAISDQPVWLPTYTDYSSKFNFENTKTLRTCAPTDFAIVNEVGLASGNPTTLRVDNVACPYYTSTGNPAERVYQVSANGALDGGQYNVNSSAFGNLGIRPAIYYYI